MPYTIPSLPPYGYEGDLADGGWAKPLGSTSDAQTAAIHDLDTRIAGVDSSLVQSAQESAEYAAAAAGLVGAPSGEAVLAAISPHGAARPHLDASFVTAVLTEHGTSLYQNGLEL